MRLETWMYGIAIAALLMVSMRAFALNYYFSGTFNQGLLKPIENTETLPIYPLENIATLNPLHTVSHQSLTSFYAAMLGVELQYHHLILGAGTELGVLSREVVSTVPSQYFIQAGSESSKLYLAQLRLGLNLAHHNRLYLLPEAGFTSTSMSNYQSIFLPQTLKEHERATSKSNIAYGLALTFAHDEHSKHYFAKLDYIHIPPGEIDIVKYALLLNLHTHQLGMLRLVMGMTI